MFCNGGRFIYFDLTILGRSKKIEPNLLLRIKTLQNTFNGSTIYDDGVGAARQWIDIHEIGENLWISV